MTNKTPPPPPFSTMDYITLALALLSWLFPDIPLLTKGLMSFVLIGILVLSRQRPDFVVNTWQPFYYGTVLAIPVTLAIAEWWITLYVFENYIEFSNGLSGTILPIAIKLGLGFGVIIGLPLTLFGAEDGRDPKETLSETIQVSGAGCLLQLLLFGLIGFLFWLPTNLLVLIFSVLGPPGYIFLFGFFEGAEALSILVTVLVAMSLNLVFYVVGFSLGKVRETSR